MKKPFCICLICLFLFHSFAQKSKDNQFTLTGKIIDPQNNYVYLGYADKDGKNIKDSCVLQEGNFHFKGNMSEPTFAYLQGNLKFMDDAENPNITNFFLEPGNITASVAYNHFKEIKITGSKTQKEFELLQRQYTTIDKNSDSLEEKFSKISSQFINAHPGSYVSAFELMSHKTRWSIDSVKLLYNNLSPFIQNSFYGKKTKETIDEIDDNSAGKMAKEFNTTDINGNSISLSNFKSRYVLLDFWASWCVPCREGTPHLIELFKKYNNQGLDIIGVSVDKDIDDWKKAIKKDGITIWYNVLSGEKINTHKAMESSQSISKKFGVQVFPTKILIDKTGIIIGRYTGTDDEAALDKKLSGLFK
jgi:thiol-disulfide isomerase/thioredoxin